MKPPIFMKIQGAKSVIPNGQHLFLKQCAKCGSDFYGTERLTRCDKGAGEKVPCRMLKATAKNGAAAVPSQSDTILRRDLSHY